ncbi:hypothetical protein GCM10027199_40060 [Amycolatopsis magusensis]
MRINRHRTETEPAITSIGYNKVSLLPDSFRTQETGPAQVPQRFGDSTYSQTHLRVRYGFATQQVLTSVVVQVDESLV